MTVLPRSTVTLRKPMELVARVLTATFFADLGAGLGSAFGSIAPRRLHLMVWIAAGAMLAVTAFDVFPEAASAIGVGRTFLAAASGYALLWTISRYVYHVCPSCAIAELGDGSGLGVGRGVPLMMVALGVHSLLDGVALTADVNGHSDLGMLLGISLHKLPEGLALTLLLTGAGLSRKRALLASLGIESLTALGGILGHLALGHVGPFWPAFVTAHVAGGFLYLIGTTATSARNGSLPAPRKTLLLAGGASFALVAVFLLGFGH